MSDKAITILKRIFYIILVVAQIILLILRMALPAWENLSWGIVMIPTIIGFGLPLAMLIVLGIVMIFVILFSLGD